ncbi:hypothetical protein [Pseudomonas sp. NFACC13-1]|uniref:hypothetical protein n=1 Tax=Pseudomonas sp. NFACC13-1 TaxID=1566245 RepID=UPI0008871B36|nr:hypothetical protein [Pseudomonas sp. NFACC13-1]SDB35979.1 hypothetical protein SAMN03159290_02633 [Pseudomonas sp. NFACC13-1]
MDSSSDRAAQAAVNQVVTTMQNDVRSLMKARDEMGLFSKKHHKVEVYSERGAVYVEFDDMLEEHPKLVLARIGLELELKLFVGDFKNIPTLRLVGDYGLYSEQAIKRAVEYYVLNVCKIIEMP